MLQTSAIPWGGQNWRRGAQPDPGLSQARLGYCTAATARAQKQPIQAEPGDPDHLVTCDRSPPTQHQTIRTPGAEQDTRSASLQSCLAAIAVMTHEPPDGPGEDVLPERAEGAGKEDEAR